MNGALCPCCSKKSYEECCGPFLESKAQPPTPEALMRSRYTAYTQADVDYIARTMKSPAADQFDKNETKQWAQAVEWLKLEVLTTAMREGKGYVEFLAYFRQKGKRNAIHELSEFHFIDHAWYYVDGKTPPQRPPIPETIIRRNQSCFCGSGKKFKHCCGAVGS